MTEDDLTDLEADLLKWAGVAASVFKALRDSGVPEQLSSDLTYSWLNGDDITSE